MTYRAVLTTDLLAALIAGRIPDEQLDSAAQPSKNIVWCAHWDHSAMGGVYLAHDTLLDRSVAMKFLLSQSQDRATRQRFRLKRGRLRAVTRQRRRDLSSRRSARAAFLVSEFVKDGASIVCLDRWMDPLLSLGIRTCAWTVGGPSARRAASGHQAAQRDADRRWNGEAARLWSGQAQRRHATSGSAPSIPSHVTPQPLAHCGRR